MDSEKFKTRRYKILSYTGFYLASLLVWSILKCILVKIKMYTLNFDEWYLSIVLASILMSIKGDRILFWWFCLQGKGKIIEYKEHLLNQNNVRFYIFSAYFAALLINNSGFIFRDTQIWINTFATYVAFDRVRSNWELIKNNEFAV